MDTGECSARQDVRVWLERSSSGGHSREWRDRFAEGTRRTGVGVPCDLRVAGGLGLGYVEIGGRQR